ncbi:DUF4272 domain-containing protein [Polaribacter aestuariivivens]|uniref:DUF4272 domain-containing protein n=1 Tax=Polaribacter aestuariivivens TaxID=2304626 RepID=A0A5S3N335_9FLAO|nr:DUF4272 domain-containing protein [Polaribacter aestuariivivens]TMM29680.1 DUF4272 domain-containing protein [Polaribacter aestuariivivens]
MLFQKKIKPEIIKKRNTKKLRSSGIEVIEHLPYLDNPDFREPKEIARRTLVLTALFQLHLQAPREVIKKWLDENGLLTHLNVEELEYLETEYSELTEQTQTDIYWFVEAIWTFAWIGGLHNNLTLNTGVEDSLATLIPNIAKNEPAEKFISNFKLRKKIEIFEMLDKIYRAHWFARNNELKGEKSEKVDLDIIMERRKALEYTCYKEFGWNEISLDT